MDVNFLSWMRLVFMGMFLITPHEGLTNAEQPVTLPSPTARNSQLRNAPGTLGKWVEPKNLLQGAKCGRPAIPKSGEIYPVKDDYNVGENVTYNCHHPKSILLTAAKRTCLESGIWSGVQPVCDTLLKPSDGSIKTSNMYESWIDRRAIDNDPNTCADIYQSTSTRWWRLDFRALHLVKGISVTVSNVNQHGGFLSPVNINVLIMSENNRRTVNYDCGNATVNSYSPVLFLCGGEGNDGINGRAVHITENGGGSIFRVCEVQVFVQPALYQCGAPDYPINGKFYRKDATRANYSCNQGFYLSQGDRERTCLPAGRWSGLQPLCAEEIYCPPIKNFAYGAVNFNTNSRTNRSVGTLAHFWCHSGYRLNGSNALTCLQNRTWSGNLPTCHEIQCPPIPFPNGKVNFTNTKNNRTVGTVAHFSCHGGRLLNGSATLRCLSIGIWNNAVPTCQGEIKSEISMEEPQKKSSFSLVLVVVVPLSLLLVLLIIIVFVLVFKWKQQNRKSSNSAQHPYRLEVKESSNDSSLKDEVYFNEAMYAHISPSGISSEDEYASQSPYHQQMRKDSRIDSQVKSNLVADPEYAVISTPKKSWPSVTKETREPVYGHVNKGGPKCMTALGALFRKKNHEVPRPLSSPQIAALYAKVNLEAKHRLKMKNQLAKCNIDPQTRNSDIHSDLDIEPVQLRELPPIPSDCESLYSSKSRKGSKSVTHEVMYDNDLYSNGNGLSEEKKEAVMVENSIYSSGNPRRTR